MRVTIEEVETSDDGVFVRFRCSVGEGLGVWRSERPARLGTLSCEFTIDPDAALGTNAFLIEPRPARMWVEAEKLLIEGSVEDVDDDGLFYLRLAPDSLTMVEAEPGAVSHGDHIRLELRPSELGLYPIGT